MGKTVGKAKLWSGLLVLFLAGALLGSAGTWFAVKHEVVHVFDRHGRGMERFVAGKLRRELNLDTAQYDRVREIVCRTHMEMQEMGKRHRPERDEIIERGMTSVREVLRPDQQREFDMLKEHRRGRDEEHGGHCE